MFENTLRLAEGIGLTIVDRSSILLIGDGFATIVRDPICIRILVDIHQLPKGLANLFENCKDFCPLGVAMSAIYQMARQGWITDRHLDLPINEAAWWKRKGIDPYQMPKCLENTSIRLCLLDGFDPRDFESACKDSGIRISSDGDIMVVLCKSYLSPELKIINEKHLAAQQPWLLLSLTGEVPMIGPFFRPDKANMPCWQCLESRISNGKLGENFAFIDDDSFKHLVRTPQVSHPLSDQISTRSAVLELMRIICNGHDPLLEQGLFTLDPFEFDREFHHLFHRPQCEKCGSSDVFNKPMSPILLSRGETLHHGPIGYRECSLEDTYARYAHLVSPITGIVPYLNRNENLSSALFHNIDSGHNRALKSKSIPARNAHLRSRNGGKGKTDIQARVGALCESVERFCMIYQGKSFCKVGSLKTMENAIHPNLCMLFSDFQFSNRDATNDRSHRYYSMIPIRFEEELEMEWAPVWSLASEQYRFLPTCFCYAQYPEVDEKHRYSYPDSNGCSAGNSIEEAALHGFLELVERDAAAIWWYNRIKRPQVCLESMENHYISALVRHYHEIGRSLWVLDITSDLRIPSFCAISHNTSIDQPDEIVYAFGAHLDATIAIERALTELNQLMPNAEPHGEGYLTNDPIFVAWLKNERISDHPYLIPIEGSSNTMNAYCNANPPSTIHDSLRFCIETAKMLGLDTLVLDLTQPDIGLPVVRVFVPGLRHMWRRTAPGRLYDVPVKMGWLEKPLTEEELNPINIFI